MRAGLGGERGEHGLRAAGARGQGDEPLAGRRLGAVGRRAALVPAVAGERVALVAVVAVVVAAAGVVEDVPERGVAGQLAAHVVDVGAHVLARRAAQVALRLVHTPPRRSQ